jgi:RNA polymerase sigma factor (sigma-70 family)
MSNNQFVTNWIERVKQGDAAAADQIWQEYYCRLVEMARQRLQGASLAVSDEEDVAVSVFESFYRAAENGRFPDLNSRDDLWKLLLRMAARKIIDRHRHANRARRGGDAVTLTLNNHDDSQVFDVIGDEPSPEMVAMMTESCEQLLAHLSDSHLRDVAVGKMEGHSNAELAKKLDCSERTIERRMKLIRQKISKELLD